MFLGLTARLEGEEMPRADRRASAAAIARRIDLPAPQQQLLERIAALGKPTVLVLLNGSALAVNWAQEHVPAIVEAWYPGQAGGHGDRRRAVRRLQPGRPPARDVLQRASTDLPPFDDYRWRDAPIASSRARRSIRSATG